FSLATDKRCRRGGKGKERGGKCAPDRWWFPALPVAVHPVPIDHKRRGVRRLDIPFADALPRLSRRRRCSLGADPLIDLLGFGIRLNAKFLLEQPAALLILA